MTYTYNLYRKAGDKYYTSKAVYTSGAEAIEAAGQLAEITDAARASITDATGTTVFSFPRQQRATKRLSA